MKRKSKKSLDNINVRHRIGKGEEILACQRAILGRDKKPCMVVVTGIPFDDNATFYKEVYVYVFAANCMDKCALKGGYNPTLQILCFNGAENSIYINIDSGGSGGYVFFYIINFNNCRMKTVFSDDMYNDKYDNYKANYKNCYLVRITRDNLAYGVDISCKGMDYLNNLYYPDGTLKKPTEGSVYGANISFPIVNRDYSCDLIVYQEVVGLAHVDGLGLLQNRFSFHGDCYKNEDVSMMTYSYCVDDCLPLC